MRGIVWRAALGALDSREIRGEIERQLDHFEARLGFAPDHIDAHQHVHVLPSIRRPLLEAVVLRYPQRPPLLRNPADRLRAIIARRHPGHPDGELAQLDSVVERRRMEYTCLMRDTGLQHIIWRPARKSDGPGLFWPQLQSDG